MENKFTFYIHSSLFNPENFLEENFENFYVSIENLFEVGRHLKAEVYYSKSDLLELVNFFRDMDYNFGESLYDKLDILLADFIEEENSSFYFEVNYNSEYSQISYYKDFHFTNFISTNNNIIYSIVCEEKKLLYVKPDSDFEIISLKLYSNPTDIWSAINNLEKRNYNYSPKHGDSTRRAVSPNGKKASQLLCTSDEAKELLKSAIYDKRSKQRFCFNFDENKETYIIFPYEGTNNQYHAYHVERNEWEKEVPLTVRKYFNRIYP